MIRLALAVLRLLRGAHEKAREKIDVEPRLNVKTLTEQLLSMNGTAILAFLKNVKQHRLCTDDLFKLVFDDYFK